METWNDVFWYLLQIMTIGYLGFMVYLWVGDEREKRKSNRMTINNKKATKKQEKWVDENIPL